VNAPPPRVTASTLLHVFSTPKVAHVALLNSTLNARGQPLLFTLILSEPPKGFVGGAVEFVYRQSRLSTLPHARKVTFEEFM